MGEYQSGQMGQTVNLLVYTFGGSNPSSPTLKAGISMRFRLFHILRSPLAQTSAAVASAMRLMATRMACSEVA